jgi:hypothetical protein
MLKFISSCSQRFCNNGGLLHDQIVRNVRKLSTWMAVERSGPYLGITVMMVACRLIGLVNM